MKRFLYHSAVSVSPTFARVLGALSEVRERAPLSARCCLVPATPSQTPAWTRLAAPCTPIFCTPSFSRALTQHSRCVLPHLLTSDVSATSVHRIIRPTAPAHCRRAFQQRHMIGYYHIALIKPCSHLALMCHIRDELPQSVSQYCEQVIGQSSATSLSLPPREFKPLF